MRQSFSINSLLWLPLVIVICWPLKGNAQDQDTKETHHFNFSGQLRPRIEFRDGAFQPLRKNDDPAALVSERLRLTFDYTYGELLQFHISPQHVGIWGQSNPIQGPGDRGDALAFFEAWAKLKLSSFWDLKIGRQVIALDDERIFGEVDWAQGGRTHDALSLHFDRESFDLKGFFAFNQNYDKFYHNNLNNPTGYLYSTEGAFSYKWMQTLWAGYDINEESRVSVLATNLGLQNAKSQTDHPGTHFTQIFGANYFYRGNRFSGKLSGYYQSGKDNLKRTRQAYLLAASLGYQFTPDWNIGVGSDFLSGSSVGKSGSDKNKTFDPFFHTGHKFYGTMDYYFVGNPHKATGLSDNYLKVSYSGHEDYAINLTIHQFVSPNSVYESTKSYSKNLGQELDLSFNYAIYDFATLSGGYSVNLPTSTTKYLKEAQDAGDYQHWAWISLDIHPRFL